jgi:transcription antitermination factor NusG
MNWYCIHTKPLKEAHVAAHCGAPLGLETYYPRLRGYRTIRRVRRLVVGPLFPRYLFCRFDPGVSFRAVRYAPDVLDIVHVGAVPAIVEDGLIAGLRQWAGDALDETTVRPTLRTGAPVEIIDGPLRGLTAIIAHAEDGEERVAILLTLLQHGTRMTISREQLKAVG